jgi:uncharacterized membrane protein YfcA
MVGSEQDLLAAISGSLVGLILGLVGGGGSIIAVPLLLYVVGVASPHVAIGTSAIAVALSGLFNLMGYARRGLVKWPCALTFSSAGILGAWAGSAVAMRIPGEHLLALFGVLMIVVGAVMAWRRDAEGNPDVRLSMATARQLLPLLLSVGFSVGLLSGFFGIGGGFLIVPGLIFATGMPIAYAIGTSLAAVTAFGATTAGNYAFAGLVDWRLAAFFILGGFIGGIVGLLANSKLATQKRSLAVVFAGFVILIGLYVTWKGIAPLLA